MRALMRIICICILSLMYQSVQLSVAQSYRITQGDSTLDVIPILRAQGPVSFYSYSSASAHTPFVELNASKIYFYINSNSGELSLIIHHGKDESGSQDQHVDFDITGVPEGAYIALSDDDQPPNNAHEFSLDYEPEGNWMFGNNTDGGVLRALPTDSSWSIAVIPNFMDADSVGAPDITEWVYQEEENGIQLSMIDPLTLIYYSGCIYVPGDANGSGSANGLDVVYMVNYLKGEGPTPPDICLCPPHDSIYAAADANGSCSFNGIDVVYLVNYLKGEGPAPVICEDCPPMEF